MWDKGTIVDCLQTWFTRLEMKALIFVLFRMLWVIWIARNALAFENRAIFDGACQGPQAIYEVG